MLTYMPLLTKMCSVTVILIALWIMIDTVVHKKNNRGKSRYRWMLLAISCMTWGLLVWVPLIPQVTGYTHMQTAIYLLRLFSLFVGIWSFIGLYNDGEMSLRKPKAGADD